MSMVFLGRSIRTLAVMVTASVVGSLLAAAQPSYAADIPTSSFANRQNGLCIERSGDRFVLNICDAPNRRQLFTFDAPNEDGVAIRQAGLEVCVRQEVVGGVGTPNVTAGSCAFDGRPTRWTLIFVGGGYRIRNAYSGQYLDGSSNLLRVLPRSTSNNQLWRIFDSGITIPD